MQQSESPASRAVPGARQIFTGPAGLPIAAVALVALIWSAYAAALDNGFVWDDHGYLEFNPALTSFTELRHAFDRDANQGANPLAPLSYNYRPVTFASLYLNARVLGATARSFHIGNLILHAALALLLLVFLRQRVGGTRPWALGAAFIATCWWALHPEQVETVAWASGRYDLLGSLFCMAALILQTRQGRLAIAAQGVLLFLAIMAKESFVPMFAILAVDDWTLGRLDRRAIPKYVFFGAIFCVWQWIRFRAGTGSLTFSLLMRPVVELAIDYSSAIAIYTERALAPFPLAVAHTYRPVAGGIVLLVLVLLVSIVVALWRKPRWMAPFMMFALMLGMVGLVLRASGNSAERYFYGPSIGLAWLLAIALGKTRDSQKAMTRYAVTGVTVAVIGLNFFSDIRRVEHWRSDATLFSEELENGLDDWLGLHHMAVIDAGLGDFPSALSRIETARQHALLAGATTGSLAEILFTEGMIYLRLGNGQAALERAQAGLKLLPGFPSLHLEAAMAFNRLGDEQGEYRELAEALHLSPEFPEARIAMCRLKHSRKDFEGARRELDRVPASAAAIPEVARALKDAANELENDRNPAE